MDFKILDVFQPMELLKLTLTATQTIHSIFTCYK
jgi:hypothetical protein